MHMRIRNYFAVLCCYPSYHPQIHIMTGSHGTVVGYAICTYMRHALAHHNPLANHIAAHSNLPHHYQRDIQADCLLRTVI